MHEQGNEAVKAAILAFGARHPFDGAAPDAEPDWKTQLSQPKLLLSDVDDLNLSDATLSDTDLTYADLSDARLIGANLAEVTWSDGIGPMPLRR